MTNGFAQFAYAGAAVLGTICIAVAHAELRDPNADPFKRLNVMIAQVVGGIAIFLVGISTLFFFGVVYPGLFALLLYAGYRIAITHNLSAAYPFNYAIAISAVLFVAFAMINVTTTQVVFE